MTALFVRDKILALLVKGPKTMRQLESSITHHTRSIQRAMATLQNRGRVYISSKTAKGANYYALNVGEDADTFDDPMQAFEDPENLVAEQQMAGILKSRGYRVGQPLQPTKEKFISDASRFLGDEIKIGIVSDTHLGSINQQLTNLESMYDIFVQEGVEHVVHAGDLIDGGGIYPGQVYRDFVQGPQAQAQYAIDKYPRRKGLITHAISGNHDQSFKGVDAMWIIDGRRKDIDYLGYYQQLVEIGGIHIMLNHGAGASGAGRSAKLEQYIINSLFHHQYDAYVLGHYHTVAYLPNYKGVLGVQPGAFQGQTEYVSRLGHTTDDIGARS